MQITVFTDGSYSPKYKIGTWASCIILRDDEKILSDFENDTSQHAMELLAVIKSISYVEQNISKEYEITVYTDSAYVEGLIGRKEKLLKSNFKTKKEKDIANRTLVELFYETLQGQKVKIIEVESHKKQGVSEINDYNRKVDKLARKNLKEIIRQREITK
ncbi:MAG: hypothetical protein PF487_05015 [Bacteroidales bacterium]|jgi:ribonuclease HI|nr:hypothetical protein [Bacteroidales bacterium]